MANAGTDQHGAVGATIALNGSGSSDVDGDLLTYTWSLIAKPIESTATLSDASAVEPTFVLDQRGTYTVQLTVHDGLVDSEAETVTISTLVSKPVANPGPDQHGTIGTTITLNGSGSSDAEGSPLTYQWSLISKPPTSTATLQNATSVSSSFVLDKPGTYIAQLMVRNSLLRSDPATVTITTLNSKPVANAGQDQEALVGQVIALNGSGSHDVDGDALSFFWSLTVIPQGSNADVVSPNSLTPSFTPDVAGTYVIQLIVNDGHLDSEPDTATVTITVPPDTTPPVPADLSKITVSGVTNGQVTVTGAAGSVEGGAQVKITNIRTAQTVTATAGTDGSFTTQFGAQVGDLFTLVVTDAAGNNSTAVTTAVGGGGIIGGPPPQIAITAPLQGAQIAANHVRVTGTVQGSFNTGVVVNGIVALVYNGTFVADDVPLVAGQNTLTVVATSLGTQSSQAQVTVSSDGAPVVLDLSASPTTGIAPLAVNFTYQFGSTTAIHSLSLDFDGNGTADFMTTDPNAPLQYTYTTPGLYLARLQITDQQNITRSAEVSIVVQDVVPVDAMFKSMWGGMNAALLNGNKAVALEFLTLSTGIKYGPVFDVLLPYMPGIVASYSLPQRFLVSADIAEYAVDRTINGENRLFLIAFIKDAAGVWHIDGM